MTGRKGSAPGSSSHDDLRRIRAALEAAAEVLEAFTPGAIDVELKRGGDPVTEADRQVNERLHRILPRSGEGWLSEETRDDRRRLECRRVWVVDPVDGTREFIQGIPEWCVSIGLVDDGVPRAAGIFNPAAGQMFLGSLDGGATLNGEPARPSRRSGLDGGVVLASRSELRRGEWEPFRERGFEVRPCGSVAYKLAQVAAGLADATWTLVPKHEWDVAAGVALIRAAGGSVFSPSAEELRFNRAVPKFAALAACGPGPASAVRELLRSGG